MALQLCSGRVLWIELIDPQGRNSKLHPVILTDTDADIAANNLLAGVVASHTAAITQPQRSTWIQVPHDAAGSGVSAFTRPTVAVCEWLVAVDKRVIRQSEVGGLVRPRHVWLIRQMLRQIYLLKSASKPQAPPPDPPASS